MAVGSSTRPNFSLQRVAWSSRSWFFNKRISTWKFALWAAALERLSLKSRAPTPKLVTVPRETCSLSRQLQADLADFPRDSRCGKLHTKVNTKKRETGLESWWTLLWCLWRPPSLPVLFPVLFPLFSALEVPSEDHTIKDFAAVSGPSRKGTNPRTGFQVSPMYTELYRRRGPRRWWRPLPTQLLLSACSRSTLSPETSRRPRVSPTLPLFPSSYGSLLSNVYSLILVVSEVTGTPCGWQSSLFPCSEQMGVSVFCFLVPQWTHIMRQSFGLFPNPSPRAGGPRKSRSLFGVLVSPQEYRNLDSGLSPCFSI